MLSRSRTQPFLLRAHRFEVKYTLSLDAGMAFMEAIQPWVLPDAYCDPLSHRYLVYSCYFDSPDLSHYWAKKNNLLQRHKVRLRSYRYPLHHAQTIFAEIKKKDDTIVIKERVPIAARAVHDFIKNGTVNPVSFTQGMHKKTLEKFSRLIREEKLHPKMLVLYTRMAFVGRDAQPPRVTLDFDLKATPAQSVEDFLYTKNHPWKNIADRTAILEIKYTHTVPAWLQDLLSRFQLIDQTYSKYGASVEGALGNFV